eukprot:4944384-Amphidinium_carterae.2
MHNEVRQCPAHHNHGNNATARPNSVPPIVVQLRLGARGPNLCRIPSARPARSMHPDSQLHEHMIAGAWVLCGHRTHTRGCA